MRIWSIGGPDELALVNSMPGVAPAAPAGWQCMFGPSPYIGVLVA